MAKKKAPLFIIFLVVFIDLLGFGIVIPILPYYAQAYGASATTLGWLMAVYSAMQFLFSPVWGAISDRIGRRPVLMISILGTAVSMVILASARSLGWLFFGRIFAGFCGANISTAMAYIADVTPPEDRAKGMGIIGAGFGLGFIFGPAVGGVLSRYGFHAPILFAGGLALLNFVFAAIRLEEPPLSEEQRSKNRTRRFNWRSIQESLGDARTRLAIGSFFIVTLGFTQMEATFALFTKARFHLSPQATGWLLAGAGFAMASIQGGLIGRLSRKFGEIRLVLAATFLMAVALVFMSLTASLVVFSAAVFLLAIGNGISNPSLSSLASKGASADRQGTVLGTYQSAGSLARMIGPPIAGFAFDHFGISKPFLISAALLVLAHAVVHAGDRQLKHLNRRARS